ncbi:hypothetical protein [Thalassobacillus sp. C254]|uniref:hypothetical protein n=1 Tax=Thalassobacillus sp. C254 TaxID=1225341 RepID=UPI0006D27FB0|nr:hypothetical protein [Thalassobacillus sp. C254]
MTLLDKRQPMVTLFMILLGTALSYIPFLPNIPDILITIIFVIVLYFWFLKIPISKMRNSLHERFPLRMALFLNFIVFPLLAGGMGYVFLPAYPEIWIAFIILAVLPSTDGDMPLTKYINGNVNFSLALLPIHLVLQLFCFLFI